MHRSKIRREAIAIARAAGVPEEELDDIDGLYGFRHILPSCADKARYDDSARLLVGAWSDPKARAVSAMPNLYSAARADSSHYWKLELIGLARCALANAHDDPSTESIPSWDCVFEHWPIDGFVTTAARTVVEKSERQNVMQATSQEATQQRSEEQKREVPAASDAEASSSDSSSSVSSEEPELYNNQLASIQWQMASAKVAGYTLKYLMGLRAVGT